ncbi:unnamed protein product [Rotaria socialis]
MQDNQTLQSIRYQRGLLSILDQLKLPDESIYIPIHSVDDAWKAIHTMSIRGAPAIAVCGVLSLAVELHHSRSKFESIAAVQHFVTDQLNYLSTARPTAVNMAEAAATIIDYLIPLSNKQVDLLLYIDDLLDFMEKFLEHDLADNRSIGRYGAETIRNNNPTPKQLTVLTHCNTGSLATVGFGTALGVVRQLAANNDLKLVYFTETRPYNQGSRLTAYELVHDRIPHSMICDSMAGLLMRTQPIHAVVVGADCVTANGDTANKIDKKTGAEIVIEQRPSREMTTIKGINIAAEGVQVWNPAFDVTPAALITSIITEHGVFKPDELEEKLLSLQKNVST